MSRLPIRVGWALALIVAQGATKTTAAGEFTAVVRGDDPAQFILVGIGKESISVDNGEVRLTGKPDGYFATKQAYRNYALRFEWRYERPEGLASESAFRGNSGLLLHIAGPHRVWPACVQSQLMNADAGDLFGVSGATFQGSKDADAQRRAVKPVGQWNLHEITCKDGSIVCTINGVEVARGVGASPDHGAIGWQSEGAPVRFRRLMIRVDDGVKEP